MTPGSPKQTGRKSLPRAKKRFGQNFLTDKTILDTIVEAAHVTPDDTVLEIGPGQGALTARLSSVAKRVLAVEIDSDLKPALEHALANADNVTVLYRDILKTDLALLRQEENGGKPFRVVANLPYYISTPVIMKLLRDDIPPLSCTVMVQKELAQRMAASPGNKDYGELSVVVQYFARPETVCFVPPSAFRPQPKVDSCVLNLVPLDAPPVAPRDPAFFFHVVKEAFAHRRKTLVNSLNACGDPRLAKEAVLNALRLMDAGDERDSNSAKKRTDETIRAERLSIRQFAALSDLLGNC